MTAYLARIGLVEPLPPTVQGLETILRAHRLAIPFENLDVRLGLGISLAPEDVFAKLVTRRRGGYCFEQNQLFARALSALGFVVRPLLARVWLGTVPPETPPRTHTMLLAHLDGQNWIADAGFGDGFTPAMPLEAGALAPSGFGAHHRLTRDARGWVLAWHGGGDTTHEQGWIDQYSFTLRRVFPIDLAQANHWTSTHPSARHVRVTVLGRVTPEGRISLMDRQFTQVSRSEKQTHELTDSTAYRALLAERFDFHLSAAQIDRLGVFAPKG